MSRLEQRLENDLKVLRENVSEQADSVIIAVSNALQSLQTGNKELAYDTILKDYPINRKMRDIDRLCHRFIAVHLPSGTHLRLLSAIIRVNIELERIGDYAVTIAREGVQLSSPPSNVMGRELERIASETQLMLRQSVKAFSELNADLATSTMVMSETLEYNLDTIYQEISETTRVEHIKDSLALFVVFTQLKRVADQSKNLCEDAIFAAPGSQKSPKVFRILFVDEDNSCLSQLAEAVAHKDFPDVGKYRSAGHMPAQCLDLSLIDFMKAHGVSMDEITPVAISEISSYELAEQDVLVCLQGNIETYLKTVPFHTSVVHWNIEYEVGHSDENQAQELYRTLALNISDLMNLLLGDET